jgi:hypothetical protein
MEMSGQFHAHHADLKGCWAGSSVGLEALKMNCLAPAANSTTVMCFMYFCSLFCLGWKLDSFFRAKNIHARTWKQSAV